MILLHLTDLHFKANDAFQVELFRNLRKDLPKAVVRPDFLIFSGDLVYDPDVSSTYELFEKKFLDPILDDLSLSKDRLILCPGNHDISRAALKSHEMMYKGLQDNLGNSDYINEQCSRGEMHRFASDSARPFFDFAKRCGHEWSNPFTKVYSFDAEKVSFVALNSAFGCSLDGSQKDRGQLALPSQYIMAAFHEVPSDHTVISLMHHTLSDLNESTHRLVTPIIEKYSAIYCFGHVHDPRPSSTVSATGTTLLVQGGALYEKSGHYNGYAVLRTADGARHIEAVYRSYYANRHQFDVGTNATTDGKFFNTDAAEKYFAHHVMPPSDDEVRDFLIDTFESVSKRLDETLTTRGLRETFVEPLIVRPSEGSQEGASKLNERFSVLKLMSSSEHFVIGVGKEFGSTSLLRYLTVQFHEQCIDLQSVRVPALINAHDLKPYAAHITGVLKAALPETDDKRLKLESLHEYGHLVILIDDFDASDQANCSSIKIIRESFPKARMVVAARMSVLLPEHILPVIGIEDFIFVQVRALTRAKVRALIQKVYKPEGYTVDQAVDEIMTRFGSLGIPKTPAYVVIYLSILEQDKGFSPINSSTVIEAFVETVLEKYKPEYRFRSAFDYRNQIDFLGYLAEKMCRSNTFQVSYHQVYDWTKEYFDGIGIAQDCTRIIQYFSQNKIFYVSGNDILFRYSIFVSFFIAHQMKLNASFRAWVFSAANFKSYVNEIDIYCGLNRNDLPAVEFLAEEFEKASREVAKLVAPLAWNEPLENLKLPSDDDQYFADKIARQLTSPNLPDEQRDKILENGDEPTGEEPVLSRPEVQGVLESWFWSLRALTVALKNSEGIPAQAKAKHLQAVLEGWATMLRYACLLFQAVFDKEILEVGSLKYRLDRPSIRPGVLRKLFLTIPLIVSYFLRRDLGSQKLEVQLRDIHASGSLTAAFLQTGLYADMKLDEYIGQLRKLQKRVTNSPFFLEALLVKLRDIYIRYNIAPGEIKSFRSLVVEISADVKGLKGSERTEHTKKVIEDIERRELVARLRQEKF